jgi:hypothetical protein
VHLPTGAATWVAVGLDAAWSSEAHLVASLFDAVQIGNWQRAAGKGPKPKAAPRPGDTLRAELRGAAIEKRAQAFIARQEARARAAEARAKGEAGE